MPSRWLMQTATRFRRTRSTPSLLTPMVKRTELRPRCETMSQKSTTSPMRVGTRKVLSSLTVGNDRPRCMSSSS